MSISELHAEWLRLGDRACRKVTAASYQELRDWEVAHAGQWDDLIAYDLEQKRLAASTAPEVK